MPEDDHLIHKRARDLYIELYGEVPTMGMEEHFIEAIKNGEEHKLRAKARQYRILSFSLGRSPTIGDIERYENELAREEEEQEAYEREKRRLEYIRKKDGE